MLLADMGSSELVAARIHNLKSIFYALGQESIRSKYSVSKVFEIFEKWSTWWSILPSPCRPSPPWLLGGDRGSFCCWASDPPGALYLALIQGVHEKESGITSGSGSPCAAQYVVNLRNSSITFSISGIVLGAGLLGHILWEKEAAPGAIHQLGDLTGVVVHVSHN